MFRITLKDKQKSKKLDTFPKLHLTSQKEKKTFRAQEMTTEILQYKFADSTLKGA